MPVISGPAAAATPTSPGNWVRSSSITGTVQKVSNLILNVNIYARDAASGRLVAAASADMRGNTDESWLRILDFIVKNQILAGPSK